MNIDDTHTSRIRILNDNLRTTFLGGQVVMTSGVARLPSDEVASILLAVRSFVEFTENNDPYGEHDFGAIQHHCGKVFWKIDYYSRDMMHGSEDPADPLQTRRVLTVMLAEEY